MTKKSTEGPQKQVKHPGAIIAEIAEKENLSMDELAEKLGLDNDALNKLLSGRMRVSLELSRRLEEHLGPARGFWLHEDSYYRDWLSAKTAVCDLEPQDLAVEAAKAMDWTFRYRCDLMGRFREDGLVEVWAIDGSDCAFTPTALLKNPSYGLPMLIRMGKLNPALYTACMRLLEKPIAVSTTMTTIAKHLVMASRSTKT